MNRDGHLFAHVLQFMRDGKNTVLPKDEGVLAQLRVGVVLVSTLLTMCLWSGSDKRKTLDTCFYETCMWCECSGDKEVKNQKSSCLTDLVETYRNAK